MEKKGRILKPISTRAPTRIDLAGGTLDIWPLYLFHPRSITINAAIDLYAKVEIAPLNGREVLLWDCNSGQRYSFSIGRIRILLLHQFMTNLHASELTLGVD